MRNSLVTLNKFLKNQAKNISNDKAETILSLINKDSKQDISTETRNSIIPMSISQLRLIMDHIKKIEQELEEAIDKCDYQLTTMPGISYTLAAEYSSGK